MDNTTNALTMPSRRRDDTVINVTAGDTHRSTPAFAVAVPPPLPFGNDEPFAGALLAQARANRMHAANVALAKHAEERLAAEQLRKNQLSEAHRHGQDIGIGQGFTRGWYWGLGFGVLIGCAVMYLCIKAGEWAGRL